MLRLLLFIIMFIIALRCATASPFGALLAYLWFALFRPQEWVWTDISQLRLSLILGGILLFSSIVKRSLPNISHPISKGILLFLVSGLIAQSNAVNQEVGWQWMDFFLRLSLVSLLLITLVNTQRRFFYVIIVISSCLGYYTTKAGLVSLLGGGVQYSSGLSGAFSDNNAYALAAVMILPLLYVTALNMPHDWPFRKWLVLGYWLAVPLTAFTVVCTFSRSGLLAMIASFLTVLIINKKSIKLLLIIAVTLVLVFQFVPLPEGYGDRVQTINTYEEEGETSALSRLHFWKVALDVARDNPLGVGMRNFEVVYNRYDFSDGQYGRSRSVHNSHLQALTEAGFLGGIAWITLFVLSFRACFRVRRLVRTSLHEDDDAKFYNSMATALIISMVGFMVGGSFIAMALNDLTWIMFGLAAALDRLCQMSISSKEREASNSLAAGF